MLCLGEKPLDKVHLELIMVKVTSGKKRRVDDQSMSQPAHSTRFGQKLN